MTLSTFQTQMSTYLKAPKHKSSSSSKPGGVSLSSNAEHPPCTIIIIIPTPASKMIIAHKKLSANRLNREHNHNAPRQNPKKPPRQYIIFRTLGVKQISPKLPYSNLQPILKSTHSSSTKFIFISKQTPINKSPIYQNTLCTQIDE
jgi:hypothetical protein